MMDTRLWFSSFGPQLCVRNAWYLYSGGSVRGSVKYEWIYRKESGVY